MQTVSIDLTCFVFSTTSTTTSFYQIIGDILQILKPAQIQWFSLWEQWKWNSLEFHTGFFHLLFYKDIFIPNSAVYKQTSLTYLTWFKYKVCLIFHHLHRTETPLFTADDSSVSTTGLTSRTNLNSWLRMIWFWTCTGLGWICGSGKYCLV